MRIILPCSIFLSRQKSFSCWKTSVRNFKFISSLLSSLLDLVDNENMDLQDLTYSPPNLQYRSNSDGSEGPPQIDSTSPRDAGSWISGLKVEGRRAVVERPSQRYLCALLDENCQFMPKLGFGNRAKVK